MFLEVPPVTFGLVYNTAVVGERGMNAEE